MTFIVHCGRSCSKYCGVRRKNCIRGTRSLFVFLFWSLCRFFIFTFH